MVRTFYAKIHNNIAHAIFRYNIDVALAENACFILRSKFDRESDFILSLVCIEHRYNESNTDAIYPDLVFVRSWIEFAHQIYRYQA